MPTLRSSGSNFKPLQAPSSPTQLEEASNLCNVVVVVVDVVHDDDGDDEFHHNQKPNRRDIYE